MVKALTSASTTVKQVVELSCVYCGEEHDFDYCPGNPASVNYVGILIDNFRTTHILILTTLAGNNIQISHGAVRIEMLQQ